MKYSGNITNDHITIICSDGESGTVNADHEGFDAALASVREGRFDDFMLIANPISVVHRYADGRISIDGGIVTFDDVELHTHLADRMVDLIREGHGVEPLANFLVNLYQNVSKRAIDELFGFLEISNLEITEDGCFVAYKKVREDYLDCYSQTEDNSPGATVTMERRDVDDDKDRTCSAGLHFCGRAYLNSYPGERTVVLKINPKDVVSIPSDYHNHKGRCCEYVVIGELDNGRGDDGERTEQTLEGSLFTGEGIDTVDDMAGVSPDDIVFYNSRTAARDAARQYPTGLRFKDFGADKDKGFRWATIEK